MSELNLRIKDGLICVPESLDFLSTYVLIEQEDWFEKEIGFVRRLILPGMRAIDVGANFGVYTLAMARAAGPAGAVWAYEPAGATAEFLRQSVERNDFRNARVVQVALSDHEGTAQLKITTNSEYNNLNTAVAGESLEEIALSTLDQQAAAQNWGAIDFIKIDAEGEEVRIVHGSPEFFARQSPLVMFELKAEQTPDPARAAAFRAIGYGVYRLLGAESFLVPVAPDESGDGFELNLFACKPDRAAELAKRGLLASDLSPPPTVEPGAGLRLLRAQPFYAALDGQLAVRDPAYGAALDFYAVWRDETRSPNERYAALRAALAALEREIDSANSSRLATLARTADEAGERVLATTALRNLIVKLRGNQLAPPEEPFWPVCARYDAISPGAQPQLWYGAACIERLETLNHYTKYFLTAEPPAFLDWLQATPFASAPMERRRQLMAIRAGRQDRLMPHPLLRDVSADNLNAALWDGRALGKGTPSNA